MYTDDVASAGAGPAPQPAAADATRAQAWQAAVQDAHGHTDDGQADAAVLTGLGGAAGRDQYVGAQVAQAARGATAQPATAFSGDLFRAVPERYASSYSDHSFSAPGRYNGPGQSALYTSTSMSGVQAEAAHYGGLGGKSVIRSSFGGDLLDLRAIPQLGRGALTQGYGLGGAGRSPLMRLTGEDPYSLPRALGDAARARGLSGVIAPANASTTNVALFPDDPNAAARGSGRLAGGLQAQDYSDGQGGPATRFNSTPQNIADQTPNRLSPAAVDHATGAPRGPAGYAASVAEDVGLHGRAGGARYGAAGAGAVSLAEGLASGHVDAKQVASNMALGAASSHAESSLARAADRLIRPAATPPNIAGGAAAGAEENAARSLMRAPSLAAGAGSAGAVGAVMAGGITAWNDADQVKNHKMTAGRATADVAVQAGVGLGSGAAGALAGAAVGSVVPVAGTAVGAVVGFGVGMGTSWLAQHSGLVDGAEAAAGRVLTDHFEAPLQKAWTGVAGGVDSVRSGAGAVEHSISDAGDAVSKAWHSIF